MASRPATPSRGIATWPAPIPTTPGCWPSWPPSPAERRKLLQAYLEPTAEQREHGAKAPMTAHRAIAELVIGRYVRVIVNDERTTDSWRAPLWMAASSRSLLHPAWAAQGSMPLAHSRCTVRKIHGDYLSSDLKNTVDELATNDDEAIDGPARRGLRSVRRLVVCGWSGEWDHALHAVPLRAPSRRNSTTGAHAASRQRAPPREEGSYFRVRAVPASQRGAAHGAQAAALHERSPNWTTTAASSIAGLDPGVSIERACCGFHRALCDRPGRPARHRVRLARRAMRVRLTRLFA